MVNFNILFYFISLTCLDCVNVPSTSNNINVFSLEPIFLLPFLFLTIPIKLCEDGCLGGGGGGGGGGGAAFNKRWEGINP